MTAKLWVANVCVDTDVVVVGEDVQDAKDNLDVDEAISNAYSDISVSWSEITSLDKVPYGWMYCEPYGEYTGTCEKMMVKILEEQQRIKDRAEQDKLQLKLDLGI